MNLQKTLNNLKKSKTGFFNMENFFVNFDTFKVNLLYKYKNGHREYNVFLINRNNLEDNGNSCCYKIQIKVEQVIRPEGWVNQHAEILYFFKNKLNTGIMNLSYQLFIGEYELAKNNN